jgi:hypothetical protein
MDVADVVLTSPPTTLSPQLQQAQIRSIEELGEALERARLVVAIRPPI